MKLEKQLMEENILISKKSSVIFKRIKRFNKFFILFFVLFFLNIGNKYPEIFNAVDGAPGYPAIEESADYYKLEYEKYLNLYNEIYEKTVIQQIEFEAEVVIPEYFDFKYVKYTYDLAVKLNLSPRVAFRLMYKESAFNEKAISPKGAIGLMQLMPETRKTLYKKFRVDTLNLDKNQQDIYIGLSYIKDLEVFWKDRGNSDKNLLKLSLAAYNAGYGNVIKHRGVPPFRETQDFVNFILKPHSNPPFYANMINKSVIDLS